MNEYRYCSKCKEETRFESTYRFDVDSMDIEDKPSGEYCWSCHTLFGPGERIAMIKTFSLLVN